MKRLFKITCAFILAMAAAVPVFSQTDSETEEETAPAFKSYQMNRKGDQYIRISLAPSVPLNFPNVGSLFSDSRKLSIGGLGSLGYHYFLTDKLSVGGDASFGFNVTIGGHVLNYIPVVATVTYQPTIGKMEFPMTFGVGFAWQTYIGYTYFPGLVVNPQIGAHYRLNPSWSVGGDLSYLLMPEFGYRTGDETRFGQFATLSVTARYYF